MLSVAVLVVTSLLGKARMKGQMPDTLTEIIIIYY